MICVRWVFCTERNVPTPFWAAEWVVCLRAVSHVTTVGAAPKTKNTLEGEMFSEKPVGRFQDFLMQFMSRGVKPNYQ